MDADTVGRGAAMKDSRIMFKKVLIIGGVDPDFKGCDYCIHADDSEEICILRKCTHTITQLKECYRCSKDGDENV